MILIFHDARLPQEAIRKLNEHGKGIPFLTRQITPEPMEGHPDLFFCQIEQQWIIAPNLPAKYQTVLEQNNVDYVFGNKPVGALATNSAQYDRYILHHLPSTDLSIRERKGIRTELHVNQGYARCSTLPLRNDAFLTSDAGIAQKLQKNGLTYCLVSPKSILLPGYRYGFIGGCMGIYQNKVFVTGSLQYHPDGDTVRTFLQNRGYEVIELYQGALFDGGSLFFIQVN